MTDIFPVVTAKQIVRVLEKLGFVFVRQAGSHAIYKHTATGKRTVVPMHGNVAIKRRTLKSILNDAGLEVSQLKAML